MPPQAHAAAITQQFALHQLGNASWDVVYGEILPEVRGTQPASRCSCAIMGVCLSRDSSLESWKRCQCGMTVPPVLLFVGLWRAHGREVQTCRFARTMDCFVTRFLSSQAVGHVRKILSLPDDDSIATVQFGHNSHELVFRSVHSSPGGPPLRRLAHACIVH